LTKVKALMAINLEKCISYNQRCTDDRAIDERLDRSIVNTLNLELNIIQQLHDIDVPTIHLGKAADFHKEIVELYEWTKSVKTWIAEKSDKYRQEQEEIAIIKANPPAEGSIVEVSK
jgi:hypothetical protein